ncbi:Retrovirus-related Pol polyprotein, partial [Mucuna pruriens]
MDTQEAKELMEEVHEGTFDIHANGHSLAWKILRVGYYWTKMDANCCSHVKRCLKCQIYANSIHVSPSTLHNLMAPWPFPMWGLDMIGPNEPKASNGHRFILVAVYYFTKWVEVTSYASVTRNVMVKFIKRDIICRYGLLAYIITDNDPNLNNKMMIELCEHFKIRHHNFMPYRPKMNGVVEATYKNIKKIVQKMVVTYKDWHEMLPYTLHGYRTSIWTYRGATPYSLVYGMKVVLLVDVKIPSLRVLVEVELEDLDWVNSLMSWAALPKENQKGIRQKGTSLHIPVGRPSAQENLVDLQRSKGKIDSEL